MQRNIENANVKVIKELLKKIKLGILSMQNDYKNLFSDDELIFFQSIYRLIVKQIDFLEKNVVNKEDILFILRYDDLLKPYIFRCWDYEVNNGFKFVSWFKNDKLGNVPPIVSTTFSNNFEETFCEARYGISYEVTLKGFLGACNKDAATLVEDISRLSFYTIGRTKDDKVVNSYNLATPIITPIQVFDKSDNNYKSKHNEIILDSRYIIPKSVICVDENDMDMVNLISSKYNIPIDNCYRKL